MTVFEEDGSPVIPPDEKDLVHIGTLGGGFSTSRITLGFYSKTLDRHRITANIGIEPSKAWNPLEEHAVGNRGKTRIVDWGKWYWMSEPDGGEIEKKITDLFDRCNQDLNQWKILSSEYEGYLTIGAHMDSWNCDMELSARVLKAISDRGLDMSIDIYHDSNDEDEP
jgi:hypothetical protein